MGNPLHQPYRFAPYRTTHRDDDQFAQAQLCLSTSTGRRLLWWLDDLLYLLYRSSQLPTQWRTTDRLGLPIT